MVEQTSQVADDLADALAQMLPLGPRDEKHPIGPREYAQLIDEVLPLAPVELEQHLRVQRQDLDSLVVDPGLSLADWQAGRSRESAQESIRANHVVIRWFNENCDVLAALLRVGKITKQEHDEALESQRLAEVEAAAKAEQSAAKRLRLTGSGLGAALEPVLDENGHFSPRLGRPVVLAGALEAALPYAPPDVAEHVIAVVELLADYEPPAPPPADMPPEEMAEYFGRVRNRELEQRIERHMTRITFWVNAELGEPSRFRPASRIE